MPQDYFSEYFIYSSLFIFFGADLDNSLSKLASLRVERVKGFERNC